MDGSNQNKSRYGNTLATTVKSSSFIHLMIAVRHHVSLVVSYQSILEGVA